MATSTSIQKTPDPFPQALPVLSSVEGPVLSSVERNPLTAHPLKRMEAVKGKRWPIVIQLSLPRLPRSPREIHDSESLPS
jgi:hypothetical protein